MGIIVDIIIVAIVALSTFLAYRKGLVKLAIHLCSFLIAVLITFLLYQPVSNFIINATSIDESIENTIYEKANEIIQGEENDGIATQITETAKNEMLPETARTLAVNIVKGGVIVILYIAIKIILRFVTALADAVSKLPILNQMNKAGGVVYGILRGILVIYILLLIVGVFGQINPENIVQQNIDKSFVGKTMYENNILKVFLK